jgi:hypothetical protein
MAETVAREGMKVAKAKGRLRGRVGRSTVYRAIERDDR